MLLIPAPLLPPASPTGENVPLANATVYAVSATVYAISNSAANSPSAVLSLKQAGLPATAASEYSSASSALEPIFKAGLPNLLAAAIAVDAANTAHSTIAAAITKAAGVGPTTTAEIMASATPAGVAAMAAARAAAAAWATTPVGAAAEALQGSTAANASYAGAGATATTAADLSSAADMYETLNVFLMNQLQIREIPWLSSYSAFASELAATYALTNTGPASLTLKTAANSYSAALSAYVSSLTSGMPTTGMSSLSALGVVFRTAATAAAAESADDIALAGGSPLPLSALLADNQALNSAIQAVNEAAKTALTTLASSTKYLTVAFAHLDLSNAAEEAISTLSLTPSAERTPLPAVVSKPVIKKATITCVRGKLERKVTALKPICPNGYKKK